MKYPNIIGREVEISTLERLYKSKKSEFVAIYGRRRIGKSYLVSEVYGGKIVFSANIRKERGQELRDVPKTATGSFLRFIGLVRAGGRDI